MMNIREKIAKELHKPVRRNFPRLKVTLKGIDDLFQGDLVEMLPYSRENKGYRYILTLINCFSKLGFAIPLKTKQGKEVALALEPIFKQHKTANFQTDQGKEFFNSHVRTMLRKYNINHYATFSDLKASIVERYNKSLKNSLYKAFTINGKYKWLDLLPVIVKKYNNTKHRTTGMKPKDVTKKHEHLILGRINVKKSITKHIPKFKVNDFVRISKHKTIFKKGYLPNWTNEVFRILLVKHTTPVTYMLQDSKGNIVQGGFYEQELSKTETGNVYLVEKVLKRKGDKVLVRWLGFDKKDDTWIDKNNYL